MKKISIFSIFFLILFPAPALDLTGLQDSLSEIFSSSVDDNEGSTTFRSMNIPCGGRTESLGTVFTAICDDASFFDYNPAASAVLEKSEIAVYHNTWISDSAQETLALTRRNGSFGYGAQLKCFYVPFSEYNLYGDRVASSYYSETSLAFNTAYNFLSGYTFKGLTLGTNAKLAWRNVPDYTDNQNDSVISGSGLEQSALGIMADFGLLLRFSALKTYQDREPNIKVGLSLNNFGIALTGFGSSVKKDDDVPSRISFGLSYRPFQRFTISTEIRKPLVLSDLSASTKLSFGVGAEAKITDFFAFQTGFLLQGANPRISMGSEFEIKGIKMDVAYTFDLTSSANPINHISLSAKMTFGDRGRKEAMQKVDEAYLAGLKLYAEGYYTEALYKWNEAIIIAGSEPLDMRYEPAIQAKNAAINFNSSKFELESMYSIDFEE
ncbi:MAG: UPF0164 family protein [Treponema sp.]|nr:UPF0164 family protein [Treponema sp.]